MKGLKIPLDFLGGNVYKNNTRKEKDKLSEEQELKKSICDFLKLLLNSPNGSFKPDYGFGFSLNNFKFENIGNATGAGYTINDKKIKNYNTDLQKVISKFETRLSDVQVTVELNSEKTIVDIIIKAKILNNIDFSEKFAVYIWKKR